MSHWREIGPRVEILWDSFISLSFCLSFFLLCLTAEHVHLKHFLALNHTILPIM